LERLEDRTLPSGLFSDPIISTNSGGGTTAIVTGNFINVDTQPDVLALNGGSGHDLTLQLFVSNAQGQLTARGSPIDTGSADFVHGAVTGDCNSDGDLDVAFVAQAPTGLGQIEVWLGHGDGTFTQAPSSPIPANLPLGLVAAYFNGHLDLAFTDQNVVTVLLNDGKGTFTPKSMPTGLGGSSAIAVAAGYLNGDGSMDLAVTSVNTNSVNVFLGDGLGGFHPVTGGPFQSYATGGPDCLQVGEFDGDTFPDVAVVGITGADGGVTVLKGDGTGAIAQQPATDLGQLPYTDVVAADFNGDHRPDLFVTSITQSPHVLLCNGSDGFTDSGPVNVAALNYPNANPSVAVADFNGDGKPDVVLVDNQGNLEVLLNQSGLVPTPTSVTLSSSANPSVAGQPVTITATVVPQAATGFPITGTVTFTVDGVTHDSPVNNGQATLTITPSANRTIAAYYSGDGNYTLSQQYYVTQTVRTSKTFTWSGAGPDGLWSDGANWVGGILPAPGDRLVFPQSAAQHTNTNDYVGGSNFYSITFTGVTSQNSGYTLQGQAFTIGAGGIVDKTTGKAPLYAPDSIACDLSGTAANLTIAVYSSAVLELHGTISGTARLVKLGSGRLSLFGTNTYTNTTLIQQGSIQLNDAAALGSMAASVIVAPQGILRLAAGIGSVANPLVIQPQFFDTTSPFPQLINMGGNNTWAGPIQLAPMVPSEIAVAGQLTLSGTVSGVGAGLYLVNPFYPAPAYVGTLVLSGTNTYSGGTYVYAGVLSLQNKSALGGDPQSGPVTVYPSGTLQVQGGLSFPYSLHLEGGHLESLDDGNAWAGVIDLPDFFHSSTIQADAGTFTLSGAMTGLGSWHKTGEGELLLAGANYAYGSQIEVDAGILRAQTESALGGPKNSIGSIIVQDGATLELSGNLTYANPLKLAGSGVDNAGALRLTDSGSIVTLTGTIKLTESSSIGTDAGTRLNLPGTVVGGDDATLDKVGSGLLMLAGSNKYLGPTEILEGQVGILTSTSFGMGVEGITVFQGGSFGLYGGSAGITIDQPLTLDGQGGSLYSLENVSGNNTWSGPITLLSTASVYLFAGRLSLRDTITGLGGAGLIQFGGGTLSLAGNNNSLGPLTVLSGGLSILGSTSASDVTLPSGTTSVFAASAMPLIVSGNLTLGAELVLQLSAVGQPPLGGVVFLIRKTSAGVAKGTFADLPEGATFAVGNARFVITYHGGSGSDVVVTRVA
jgi:autotransporter-associated beta strand protein